MLHFMSHLLLILLILPLLLPPVQTTDIKFTPGTPHSSAAARAPRSQKYWDEHDIKRPDYAKTDAEIWQERWGPTVAAVKGRVHRVFGGLGIWMFVVVTFVGVAGWRMAGGAARVVVDDKEAREARLRRFDDKKVE